MTHGAIDDAHPCSVELLTATDHVVLVLRGEADMVVVPTLERVVVELGPPTTRAIAIDVSDLTFLDCAVVGWIASLRDRGCTVRIDGATGLVARVIDLVGWTNPPGDRPDGRGDRPVG